MRISGVLVLFPLTVILTFAVMQKEVELQRPFERHAGAYTDIPQLIAALKNAGQTQLIAKAAPRTMPRRPATKEIKIETKSAPITIAQVQSDVVKTVNAGVSKNEAMLEEIWREHTTTPEKSQTTQAAPVMASAVANPQAAGLLSPVVQNEISKASAAKPNTSGERGHGFDSNEENAARLDVMILSATINQGAKEIDGVEFASFADENNIIFGDKGRMTFEYLLGQTRQTLSGVFTAKDHVRTRVDLPLEVGSFGSLVPMMTIAGMDSFLRKHKINAPGGFILVDLDQQIIDVEIDRAYQLKSYLNSDLQETDADDSARFVLFAGVAPGNVMLRYLSGSRDIVERVALVAPDEILYDLPVIAAAHTHSFGLFEMESLSLMPRELTLSSRAIRPFNRKSNAVQDSLNYYSLDFAPGVVGARRYTEIDHLGTTFYVGHHGNDKLIVPGQGFLNEVLEFHQMDRIERECMIQVNLPQGRELYEVHALGTGAHGPLLLDQSFLNRDGTVSVDATEFSTHAFILGDMQGQIHLRLDYVDGAVDFISSFCVPGAYLVEQL